MFYDDQSFSSKDSVTLIGAGPVSVQAITLALVYAKKIIAVDGGLNHCLRHDFLPELILGDFDSLTEKSQARYQNTPRFHMRDQNSTDFEKALRVVRAPFFFGVGFLGGRQDHTLAAMNALVRSQQRCILIGAHDVVFHVPPGQKLALSLRKGDRVSLFPMAQVSGQSSGLEWPISGISFAPDQRIGTSNRAISRDITLKFDGAGMLCFLPPQRLGAVIEGLERCDVSD